MVLRSARRVRTLLVLAASTGLVLTAGPAFATASANPLTTWGANDRVKAMVTIGGKTVIGGDFTSVIDTSGHSFPAAHLAVVDANTGVVDRTWTGGTDDSVYALAVSGSTVYVGGAFNKVDGVSHRNLAAISLTTGALVTGFTATTNGAVDALAVASGSLVLGGRFSSVTVGTSTTSRSFLAKVSATSGALDPGWAPKPDLRVRSLIASANGTQVYVGGDFATINGSAEHVTALLPIAAPGNPVTSYHGGATNNRNFAPAFGLDLFGSTLYVAAGGGGGGCTALNATTGAKIWGKHTNGNVQAVKYSNGIVYCGGHFGGAGSFDGQERYKMGAVMAAAPYTTTSFAPKFNSALGIWSLADDGHHLFVGGDSTKVNQKAHDHYAVFTDTP